MIKLIVSDIDGTLTKDGGNKLNPELFSVIMKLKEKGIHFAAVSGRQAASLETLFEPIRDQIFYVGDNGAYVGCYGRNLFLTEIRRKTAVAAPNMSMWIPKMKSMSGGSWRGTSLR